MRALTLALIVSSACARHASAAPEKISVHDFELAKGPTRPSVLTDCKTVETEFGECIEAGTYEGDPVLLLGHRPIVYVEVSIDYHGAGIHAWPCDSGLCADKLPTATATIVVPEAP